MAGTSGHSVVVPPAPRPGNLPPMLGHCWPLPLDHAPKRPAVFFLRFFWSAGCLFHGSITYRTLSITNILSTEHEQTDPVGPVGLSGRSRHHENL
jgi:hypothetical protein